MSGTMHKSAVVTSSIPGSALDTMNWMRGIAALAVLIGHIRGLFFVDYDELPHPTHFLKFYYLITAFGHQAVIVFFVLSGFFIGTSVATSLRAGVWSWQRFAMRRFTRLYVVLIPALVLTVVWDCLGLGIFGSAGVYGGHVAAPYLDIKDIHRTLTPLVFLGNLAFLQDMFVSYFGSNSPLWSLSYEFWSYITFPLLLTSAFVRAGVTRRILLAVAGISVLVVLGSNMRFYFSIWSLGAILAIAWSYKPFSWRHPAVTAAAVGLFAGALLVGRLKLLHHRQLEDVVVGLSTVLLLMVLLARSEFAAARRETRVGRAYARWGEVVAGFSYTLYVCHYPAVTFFQAWFVGTQRWMPTPAAMLETLLLGLGIVVVYAYPLARCTEARTDDVRLVVERFANRVARRLRIDGP